MNRADRSSLWAGVPLLGVLLIFAGLLLPTIDREGINWDEQTDLGIAAKYVESRDGLLSGSPFDLKNVRIPMYSTALLFRMFDSMDLQIARLTSAAVSILTLLAVYFFCSRELDRSKGLVACLILATSPYFLSFSGMAFSEGDVFVTCAVSWALASLSLLRARPSLGRAGLAGFSIGLALSSKISAVALLPVALVLVGRHPDLPLFGRWRTREFAALLLVASLFGLWLLLAAAESGIAFEGLLERVPAFTRNPAARWAFVAVLLSATLIGSFVRRRVSLDRLSLLLLLGTTAALTFFTVPPVHTGNTEILGGIWRGFFYTRQFDPALLGEMAALHFLALLLKPSLVVGLGLWMGLLLAVWRARTRVELRLPLLIFLFYFSVIMLLPFAQPHYMMPLFPLLAIFAADALMDLHRRHRSIANAVATAASFVLFVDLYRCYPDYNLNGYQWTAERYIAGRSSIGYRSIVNVRSDGAEQGMRWLNDHAGGNDTVVHFLPPHIAGTVSPNSQFRLLAGRDDSVSIADADFVVSQFNNELRGGWGGSNPSGSIYGYPYDRAYLESEFVKVFTVRRAFGIEVAAVWKRK